MAGNKIHFTSLGCPRNLVDSEVMLGLLMRSGYEIIPEASSADYLIVNTCGFLQTAREEGKSVIRELLAEKKPSAKIIVTGCMVQLHKEEIREAIPEIDVMLGSGDVESILQAIREESPGDFITSAKSYLEQGEVPRTLSGPPHYAYLKIAEGCRKRCSFCIIPKIKGPLKSKSIKRIVKEFHMLLDQGVREIILIAQDLGDYGKDIGYPDGGYIKELLRTLLKIKKDFWLRLLYVYPDEIDEEFVDLMKSDSRLLPYLDMPMQHVNNRLLKLMRRKTTREDLTSVINLLRKKIPNVMIRTSLMVGFPSETEEEFSELCDFVKKYPLDNVGVFRFSPEAGAAASSLEGAVEESVKEERYGRLMEILKKSSRKRLSRFVGKTLDVVVEGYHPDSSALMRGRFYGQSPEIDGIVILNDHEKVDAFGALYRVEITRALDYDLIGKVIGKVVSKPAATKGLLNVVS